MRFSASFLAVAIAISGATAASAQDEDVRFYGRESFTIVYELTGSETGEITEHVREWGRRRVEIRDTQLSVMGFVQSNQQRVIYDRDQVITIDAATGATTLAENPIYNDMAANLSGQDGVDFANDVMTAMGGTLTGETGEFAGQTCAYWDVPTLMSVNCVSEEGASLHVTTTVMGMTAERRAVEFRADDGGPDEAFAYDADAAVTTPSLEDIVNAMQGGGG